MPVVPPPPPVPVRNSGQHAIVPPPAPAAGASRANGAPCRQRRGAELGWDDEELATNIYDSPPPDAGDAVVDDKPDLSKLELSPDGAPVPHHSVAQKLPTPPPIEAPPHSASRRELEPTAAPRNGAGRRRNPFDYVLPDAATPSARRRADGDSVAGARGRRRAADRALHRRRRGGARRVCVAAVGGIVYYNSRPGTLFITSDPATNVQILLDNKRQPVDGTPATLKLEPGSYVLTVQREGYVPWNEQVEVKPGDTTRRRITLEPLASGTGFTLVSEPAGAQALLDGRALEGVTPLKVQSVMPGKHKIEVKTATGSWQQEVTIEAGKMLDVRATIGVAAKSPNKGDKGDKIVAKPPEKLRRRCRCHRRRRRRRRRRCSGRRRSVAAVRKTPEPAPVAAVAGAQSERAGAAARQAQGVRQERWRPSRRRARPPDPALPEGEKPKKVACGRPGAPSPRRRPTSSRRSRRRRCRAATAGCASAPSRGPTSSSTARRPGCTRRRRTSSWRPDRIASRLTNPQFNIKETFSVDIKAGETETVIKDLRPQGGDSD